MSAQEGAYAEHRHSPARAYRHMFERVAVDVAFLWLMRLAAVDQPHYRFRDLAELDQRIEAQFDFLLSSPELASEVCEAELVWQGAGESFAATVLALRSRNFDRTQYVIESSLAVPSMLKGVISALGWVEDELVRPWIRRLLDSNGSNQMYLGITACSVRREDPGQILAEILETQKYRDDDALQLRALRLVGELGRKDLFRALHGSTSSDDRSRAFWASWSLALLGYRDHMDSLRPFALEPNPFQANAVELVFRALPILKSREWISSMARNPDAVRVMVRAIGVLGDPHAVNWLISCMEDPGLARLAGESFSVISGIDLEEEGLCVIAPANPQPDPIDETDSIAPNAVDDDNLPWPDAEKVAVFWRRHGSNFVAGERYFLGRPITPDWLRNRIAEGTQRQRHAAALELALLESRGPLQNTRARVAR